MKKIRRTNNSQHSYLIASDDKVAIWNLQNIASLELRKNDVYANTAGAVKIPDDFFALSVVLGVEILKANWTQSKLELEFFMLNK